MKILKIFINNVRFRCGGALLLILLAAACTHLLADDPGDSLPAKEEPEEDCKPCETCPKEEDEEVDDECEEGATGDPIFLTNGEFYLGKTLLDQPGTPVPFSFSMRYSSYADEHNVVGYGWTHNYNQRLFEQDDGKLLRRSGQGTSTIYSPVVGEPGLYRCDTRFDREIRLQGDGTYVTTAGGAVYVYDTEGRLSAIQDGDGSGWELAFSYDPAGQLPVTTKSRKSRLDEAFNVVREWRLERVEERRDGVPTGRFLEYHYGANGLLATVNDQENREIALIHSADGYGDLEMVTGPEGWSNTFTYYKDAVDKEKKSYGLMHTFTGVGCSDCSIRRNIYDGEGRVDKQIEGANGEGEEIDIDYFQSATIPYVLVKRKVKHTTTGAVLGTVEEKVSFNVDVFNDRRIAKIEVKDPDTGLWKEKLEYLERDQVSGKVKRKELSNGAVVRYEYHADGKLHRRIEPVSITPLVERVTEYLYDVEGNKRSRKITQTNRPTEEFVTEYTYHPGTPLLHELKRKKSDGSYATTTYTYTEDGQVRTEKDPRGNVMQYEYTTPADAPQPVGLLKRSYDPANPTYQTLYEYDASGNRTLVTDAMGRSYSYLYDDLNRIKRETDLATGLEIHTKYFPSGQIEEIKRGNDVSGFRITRYGYNNLNQRTEVKRVDENGGEQLVSRTGYNSENAVLSVENALGQITFYDVDLLGRLDKTTEPFKPGISSVTEYTYDDDGRVKTVTNPVDIVTEYSYDLLGRRIKTTDAVGLPEERSTEFILDAEGRTVEKRIVAGGQTLATEYTYYDRLGRTVGINWNPVNNDKTGDLSLPRKMEYDDDGNLVAEVDGEGNRTEYGYDNYGRNDVIRYADRLSFPAPNDTTTGYDLAGNVLWTRDGKGRYEYSHYDTAGRLTHRSVQTNQDWKEIAWWNDSPKVASEIVEFNVWGQVVESLDVDRVLTTQIYDHYGRAETSTRAGQVSPTVTYNSLDQVERLDYPAYGNVGASSVVNHYSPTNGRLLLSTTDRAGGVTTYDYYVNFRSKSIISPLNAGTTKDRSWTYHPYGGVASETNERDEVTLTRFDAFGRTREIEFPDHTLVNPRIQYWTYTQYGQPETVSGAGGYPVKYSYDLAGNRRTMTDAKGGNFPTGATTTWEYDTRNRVKKKIYADQSEHSYTYDEVGALKTRTDAENLTTTYHYEPARNLLSSVDYPTDTDVSYVYDKGGRRASMTDGSGFSEWIYDDLGRLDLYRQHAVDRVIDYGYDAAGMRETMKVRRIGEQPEAPGEWITTYTWDGAGRLDSIQDDRIHATELYNYQWKPATGLVQKIVAPGNLSEEKSYDVLGRVTSIWSEDSNEVELARRTYTYNVGGQRDTVTYGSGEAIDWAYDEKRQVTDADHSTAAFDRSYTYDEIGNRTSATESGVATTYHPDVLNQYDAITKGGTTVSPTYDDNGSILNDGMREMEWSDENRMATLRIASATKRWEHLYDGDGRKVETREYATLTGGTPVKTERYLYDGWNLLAVLDGSNSTVQTQTWGLDLSGSFQGAGGVGGLLGIAVESGPVLNVFYDVNGNVVSLVDLSGSVRASYDYDPFGNLNAISGDLAASNRWRFSTKRLEDCGLYYYGFRFYDPVQGRWPSRDPLAETGGLNLFGFVGNDGVNKIDKLGLQAPAPDKERVAIMISGPDYSTNPKDWITTDNTDLSPGLIIYDGRDIVPIKLHDGPVAKAFAAVTEADRLLNYKRNWEAKHPGRRCCVNFSSRRISGSSGSPLTPGALRNHLEKNGGDEKNGLFFLVHHHQSRGIMLGVGSASLRGNRTKLDWAAWFSEDDVFGKMGKPVGKVYVYTCFCGSFPETVYPSTSQHFQVSFVPLGNLEDESDWIDFPDKALKPWVESECGKNNVAL